MSLIQELKRRNVFRVGIAYDRVDINTNSVLLNYGRYGASHHSAVLSAMTTGRTDTASRAKRRYVRSHLILKPNWHFEMRLTRGWIHPI